MNSHATLLRLGELTLKGDNRRFFEKVLRRNIRKALSNLPNTTVSPLRHRILVEHPTNPRQARERLRRVCGIKSISPVTVLETSLENIEQATSTLFAAEVAKFSIPATFCVRTNRANKRFPMTSMELDRHLGATLLAKHPQWKVQLKKPDLEVEIDIREHQTFVFCERIAGPGGLPVGTTGTGLMLLFRWHR